MGFIHDMRDKCSGVATTIRLNDQSRYQSSPVHQLPRRLTLLSVSLMNVGMGGRLSKADMLYVWCLESKCGKSLNTACGWSQYHWVSCGGASGEFCVYQAGGLEAIVGSIQGGATTFPFHT